MIGLLILKFLIMENIEWNPNDWQGKKQNQVEFSTKMGSVFLVILLLTILFLALIV